MMNLTKTQLIFLDNLIYLDFSKFLNVSDSDSCNQPLKLGKLIDKLLGNIESLTEYSPASMSKEEWVSLLTAFKNNSANADFLNDYVIENYECETDEEGAFCACSFVKRNESGTVEDVAVIFRGTKSC